MNGLMHLNFASVQKAYGGTIKKPFSVNGILLGKQKNKVQIDVGNKKIVEAVLKDRINERVGDRVFIDKSQIISMRIYDKLEDSQALDIDQYAEILKGYGVAVNEESRGAVKELEKFDIPFSRESIETLIMSKRYMEVIHQELNHDTAVKLLDKDIDIEKDSLEKVANAIKEIKEEESNVSPWRLFSKDNEMTTEEAERIAKSIYGSAMGKDIIDIIKALHRAKAAVNKKNIERIYDIFYRLGKLEGMQDEDFVNIYKEGIKPTIQNLYNAKYHVKKSVVPSNGEASRWAVKNYEEYGIKPIKITNRDLKLIKEKIISHLKEIGIQPTKENVNLAKLFIKMGISLTKESIEQVSGVKEAFNTLMKKFDVEKACKMLKGGLDIEKQDIRRLTVMNQFGLFSKKVNDLSQEVFVKGINKITNMNQIFDKVSTLSFHQISFHLSKGIPFTIKNISKTYDKLNEVDSVKNITLKDEARIKDYVKANEESLKIKAVPQGMIAAFDAGKALFTNGLRVSTVNIKRVFDIYGKYSRIRRKLSPQMIMDSVQEGKALENMTLKELDEYADDKLKAEKLSENVKRDVYIQRMKGMQKLVNSFSSMGEEKRSILPLLIKNNMPFSLREIEGISLFLRNQQQIGHKIGEMVQLIGQIHDPNFRKAILKLDKLSRKMSQRLKNGELEGDKDYQELIQHLESMEKEFNDSEEKDQLKEHIKHLKTSMKIQKKLKTFQFPVLMGDKFRNLQIYVQDSDFLKKQKEKSLTMLMNLDTNNLGQLQIAMKVDKGYVDLTIGVPEKSSVASLKKQLPYLKTMLEEIGYKLREITFDGIEKHYILEGNNQSKGKQRGIFTLEI
ncbi:flagellar hook-length control protein FliK [Crassaminicella indica]|uniref:Flagellar hook-length control protein FliK n=1 Tax=Crassaminicella indica TaxID=2855394 RepID=A0ABX8R834_9CLOT|nr:DUF6240 domain-containing protein [Crassaminicella indica]QXM05188.1 flagellar hook-length control protein FliK [Crassaminicella indica]